MHEMKIFKNEEFGQVRTTEINGEPYFVGKDVAEILGYSNPRDALAKRVDDEDKGVAKCDTLGGFQDLTVINESGLYSLILSSKLPKAKKFKHWVTSEVLPTIRKHGVYAVDEVLNNPDMMIAALTELKKEREKVQSLIEIKAVQEQQIMELQPKATYYDLVLNCKDLLSVTEIAKDFGKTAKWLNNFLKEQKIQFKQGDLWFLYKKYAEQGYTSTKTHTVNGTDGKQHSKVHTYWTQKGRLFIYGLLKSNGILPIIEQEQSA
ncbi:phage antirepressor KilAC domain-containing protein [Ruminococcus sp.]|uniref:phage antirepressor KilAC domain-containing protein n=1 Tax=Ruminococcus sp. TaxID=41978 RepID=UPI00260860F8|nr:phage antirepressor KilAC domain-containing protein [Ruminococcus sp.]MDD6988795.1 phage antirepressor KilAC domain-containing protein [Ruminococcus sp.]